MSHLIDTVEMFLKVIYETNEAGLPAMRSRIAKRLDQALPSVSQTVNRMVREGLVVLGDDNQVLLTDAGRAQAVAVMRKHRLAERLLLDVLGFDWADCHEEACRWEHVVSDAAEVRIASAVARLDQDPYGNPIPGLAEIGLAATAHDLQHTRVASVEVPAGTTRTVTVMAIGEPAQARHGLLADLVRCGIGVGTPVTLAGTASGAALTGPAGTVVLDAELAEHILVAP